MAPPENPSPSVVQYAEERDLEIAPTHPPAHHRDEKDTTASGLMWDYKTESWITDEEAVEHHHSHAHSPLGQELEKDEEKEIVMASETDLDKATSNASSDEPIWLEWAPNDPDNPYQWPNSQKWITTTITCLLTMGVAICGSSFAMGSRSLIDDLDTSSELANFALSAFPLGFGVSPLLLAPYSEAYGRYPMYVASTFFWMLFCVPTGAAKNIGTVIAFRFLGGCAASTGSTLVGGTIADLFEASNRGAPMSLFSALAFGGTGLGPAMMGYVADSLGWRWIQWIQTMFAGALLVAMIFFTRETRGSVILSRRARKMRKETGDMRYQCRTDAERASLAVLIRVSMTRPIYLLFTESILFFFSLWIAFAWGFVFLTLDAVPLVFTKVYNFSNGQVGLTFLTIVVAAGLGVLFNIIQERLYQKHFPTRGPEARLFGSCVGGLAFAGGIFIFAFSQGRGHFMGPLIGLVVLFVGIFTIYLAVFNYLADCYTIYSSSALSAMSLCRNLAGAAFPMFTQQLFARLGFQWGAFLAGMLALALSLTPFVLMRYGPQIRAKSRFARELARLREGGN